MLTVLAYTLVFGLIFSGIGYGVNTYWSKTQGLEGFVKAGLVGFAISLFIVSALLTTPLPLIVAHLLIGVLAIAGWAVTFMARNQRLASELDVNAQRSGVLKASLFSLIPAIAYAWVSTYNLFGGGFRYRIGPDGFGWAIASKALCVGDNIASLTSRVQSQLGGTKWLDSLQFPLASSTMTQINQIPSFTDQAAFEFLVGAHRTGVPGLVGGFCAFGQDQLLTSVLLGLICWALIQLTLVLLLAAGRRNVNPRVAGLFAVVLVLSLANLSVGLEGGFGQLITLPVFAYLVIEVANAKFEAKAFFTAVAIFVAVACSTYLDVLFLAGPLCVAILFVRLVLRQVRLARPNPRSVLAAAAGILVAAYPMYLDFWRLAIFPFLHPTAGGWDQGKIPFPVDVLGIVNWLPEGHYVIVPRTPSMQDQEIWLTVALALMLILNGLRKNVLMLVTLLFYGYLMYSVYMHLATGEAANNYRLWKFGPYALVALAVLIWNVLERRTEEEPRSTKSNLRAYSKFLQVCLASALALTSAGSSLAWAKDWMATSKGFLPDAAVKPIERLTAKYDIGIDGTDGVLMPLEWAYVGNIHFAVSARGYGLPTHLSSPARPFVAVRPLGLGCDIGCATTLSGQTNVASVKRIGTTKWFTEFLVTFNPKN